MHTRAVQGRWWQPLWWCLLVAVSTLPGFGSDWTWDYLPQIGYENEELSLTLRPAGGAAGWVATDAQEAVLPMATDAQTLSVSITPSSSHHDRIELRHGSSRIAIDFVHLGAGSSLEMGPQGHLRSGEALAVLVLPRVEAQADRRWAMLGLFEKPEVEPCTLLLAEPQVAWGEPALLAQICASQRLACSGTGVLVRFPGADRFAGWKHREYRQAVAWLVADLLARSAKRVVLVEPLAPSAENVVMQPLRAQIGDVGHSYHCRLVETQGLGQEAYWDVAAGIIGTTLNARGTAALDELIRPFLRQP
jgi:hypothetical protein